MIDNVSLWAREKKQERKQNSFMFWRWRCLVLEGQRPLRFLLGCWGRRFDGGCCLLVVLSIFFFRPLTDRVQSVWLFGSSLLFLFGIQAGLSGCVTTFHFWLVPIYTHTHTQRQTDGWRHWGANALPPLSFFSSLFHRSFWLHFPFSKIHVVVGHRDFPLHLGSCRNIEQSQVLDTWYLVCTINGWFSLSKELVTPNNNGRLKPSVGLEEKKIGYQVVRCQ